MEDGDLYFALKQARQQIEAGLRLLDLIEEALAKRFSSKAALSSRAMRVFDAWGLNPMRMEDVRAMATKHDAVLLRVPACGRKTVVEIREYCAALGA